MEEAGRGEEGEEEEGESPKELESEEEEIAITGAGRLGFSALLALGGRRSFCREEEPIRGEIK